MPINVVLDTKMLGEMDQDGFTVRVLLKRTGLPIENLTLLIDPGALLKQLSNPRMPVFTVYPSTDVPQQQQNGVSSQMPFSILISPEDASTIHHHNFPTFLIELQLQQLPQNQQHTPLIALKPAITSNGNDNQQ